jgi:hypothetical protein
LILTFSILIAACNDKVVAPPCALCPYAAPTAPESLITNLQVSYRERDCAAYARILAPEFRFRFQPIDANTIGKEFWTFVPDSAGTCALFSSPEVSEIRIQLTYGGRDSTIDISPPVDSLTIRIVTSDLQVDQTDGVTWVVSDQQNMFFRKGLAARGENPNHWWIYQWDDLPTLSSAGPPRTPGPTPAKLTTWGGLKARYNP